MAKKNDGGFQSQAGLVRYFDTENDKSLKLNPKLVVGIAIGFAVIVILLNVLVPMN
jgi:preprotein translocase subunit Sec61beta